MIIVADQNIPHVADAFGQLGEVRLLPGRDIHQRNLLDCRCLITRTVTQVDADLLDGSRVEFVGSATIGTDHIDHEYLAAAGIGFANAAGCNAEAAAEYVISGLFALAQRRDFDPFAMTAGIVGYGNVGTRLKRKFDILGIECLLCDPPLAAAGAAQNFFALEKLIEACDLISLHVPLTRKGPHATYHLFGAATLQALRRDCVLINAARGEVVDNAALLHTLESRPDLCVFLDTWEKEPQINRQLLRHVALATPHIAGYSVEGRLRGTQMVLDAACNHFDRRCNWDTRDLAAVTHKLELAPAPTRQAAWQDLFTRHCNVWRDHEALLRGSNLSVAEFAAHFDGLRRAYPDRIEYPRCQIDPRASPLAIADLKQLGFSVID